MCHNSNNIINPFTMSNKDQNTSNNIRFIVFQAMHNIYNGYHQSYPVMCLITQDSLTILESKMRLRSLQSLAFTGRHSAYKHKTTKIRNHKEKYEKWKRIRDFYINQIECSKLKVEACPPNGSITTRWRLKP